MEDGRLEGIVLRRRHPRYRGGSRAAMRGTSSYTTAGTTTTSCTSRWWPPIQIGSDGRRTLHMPLSQARGRSVWGKQSAHLGIRLTSCHGRRCDKPVRPDELGTVLSRWLPNGQSDEPKPLPTAPPS